MPENPSESTVSNNYPLSLERYKDSVPQLSPYEYGALAENALQSADVSLEDIHAITNVIVLPTDDIRDYQVQCWRYLVNAKLYETHRDHESAETWRERAWNQLQNSDHTTVLTMSSDALTINTVDPFEIAHALTALRHQRLMTLAATPLENIDISCPFVTIRHPESLSPDHQEALTFFEQAWAPTTSPDDKNTLLEQCIRHIQNVMQQHEATDTTTLGHASAHLLHVRALHDRGPKLLSPASLAPLWDATERVEALLTLESIALPDNHVNNLRAYTPDQLASLETVIVASRILNEIEYFRGKYSEELGINPAQYPSLNENIAQRAIAGSLQAA